MIDSDAILRPDSSIDQQISTLQMKVDSATSRIGDFECDRQSQIAQISAREHSQERTLCVIESGVKQAIAATSQQFSNQVALIGNAIN